MQLSGRAAPFSDHLFFTQQGGESMRRILCFVPVFLLLVGMAAAQDVRMNYDQNTDFTKFKTYKWVDIKGSDKNELLDKQIVHLISSVGIPEPAIRKDQIPAPV
jgi:hypothetical protein